MKAKIMRHKWLQEDGFRTDRCIHCNCIRKWDDQWKRIIYLTPGRMYLFPPNCKRIGHCDLITKIK